MSEEFDKDFDKFEKQRELATAMLQFRKIYEAAIAAGFTEGQATKIIADMLMSSASK